MRVLRSVQALLCAVVMLTVLAPGARLGAQELTDITIATAPIDDTTPVLYAVQAGIFKKYGLNVTLMNLRNGAAIAAAVAGGTAAIGASSVMPIITAYAHGVRLPIVAPAGMYDTKAPNGMLVVLSNSPIKTARDLNNQTIGTTSINEVSTLAVRAWMDANGGDAKSLKIVETPYSSMLPGLVTGRIVAGNLISPILEQQLETGKIRVLANAKDAVAKHWLNSCWFTSEAYEKSHPAVIERFARAVREASVYANAHRAATVDLIASYAKLDPAMVARSSRPIWGERLNPVDIQPVIDVSAKYGVIDKRYDAANLISPIVQPIFH